MFWSRLFSGIFLLGVLIGSIIVSPITLGVLCTVISIIGLYEFYRIKGIQFYIEAILSYVMVLFYYIALYIFKDSNLLSIIGGYFIVLGIIYVIKYPNVNPEKILHIIFGFIYIPILFSFIMLLREFKMGQAIVGIVFIAAWGTDTLAYCTGMLFGKHKLAPILSPKKSIEGAIGGVIGSAIVSLIFVIIVEKIYYTDITIYDKTVYIYIMLICIVTSIVSQIGDLFASAFKRHFSIKDYGNIIPGHGGILDRFDSVLFAAPTIYIILKVFNLN